jgi:hypothetical protein
MWDELLGKKGGGMGVDSCGGWRYKDVKYM